MRGPSTVSGTWVREQMNWWNQVLEGAKVPKFSLSHTSLSQPEMVHTTQLSCLSCRKKRMMTGSENVDGWEVEGPRVC